MEFISRNTNTLAPKVYAALLEHGVTDTSRNGPVLRFPEPVTICLTRPGERVNFSPERDANPFFHLVEAMAMLAGLNSVHLLSHFAKRMATFSDDGTTFNAFYGTRARDTWGDQLTKVIEELRARPDSRQALVNLWDPRDLSKSSKDKACNLSMLFRLEGSELHMTTFNRSNDAVWGGVMGANVVHFPFFHEYIAAALQVQLGKWWHVSNNLHVYTENPQWEKVKTAQPNDLYPLETVPLFTGLGSVQFGLDLGAIMWQAFETHASFTLLDNAKCRRTPFLADTLVPMYNAWQLHKLKKDDEAMKLLDEVAAQDWQYAGKMWLLRRLTNGKS